MNEQDAKALLDKYAQGNCTPEEAALVERWYAKLAASTAPLSASGQDEEDRARRKKQSFENIQHILLHNKKRPVFRIRYWSAAAAIAALCCAGAYLLFHHQKPVTQIASVYGGDVAPGRNKAVLMLGDGRKVMLDDAYNGQIAEQEGLSVNKKNNRQLVYEKAEYESNSSHEHVQHTISTPSGGEYQVVLSDGSKVWLNAASSLSYPAKFTGNERLVTLTGEAYFEVAHDKEKPFKVKTINPAQSGREQLVEVLGTHFNINGYGDDESVHTTLLEGSVRLTASSTAGRGVLLTPGHQSVFKGNAFKVSATDTLEAVAWKNGRTEFTNQDIRSIMRTLARWYDIEVIYEQDIPAVSFSGSVSRSKNISQVLKVMELTGDIHFKIEGRRIIVMH